MPAPLAPERRSLATIAVLLALVVAALESTVVTTAMPTITAELGDRALYGWVFSAFLVANAISVLLCGKLADGGGVITAPKWRNMIVSEKNRDQLLAAATKTAKIALIAGGAGLGVGIILAVVASMMGPSAAEIQAAADASDVTDASAKGVSPRRPSLSRSTSIERGCAVARSSGASPRTDAR